MKYFNRGILKVGAVHFLTLLISVESYPKESQLVLYSGPPRTVVPRTLKLVLAVFTQNKTLVIM